MSKIWRGYRSHVGKPPGYLAKKPRQETNSPSIPLTCRLITYDESYLNDGAVSLEEAHQQLVHLEKGIGWLNITGDWEPSFISKCGDLFKLHPLVQEDILNPVQRAKLDDYQDYVYIVVRLLTLNPLSPKASIRDEQISLILTKRYIISFAEHDPKVFDSIVTRLQASTSRIRRSGTDYLCYALLDLLVDQYYIVLEQVDESIEALENELLNHYNKNSLWKIQGLKKEISHLRKAIWPMREVLGQYMRLETSLIERSTIFFVHDAYDHTVQAIDAIETFRDLVSGMLDIYLSGISLRLNEVLKVLTVVSTIFVPLTFIASLYGMNFDYLPGIHSKLGFGLTIVLMLGVALGMLVFFKRKRWIG